MSLELPDNLTVFHKVCWWPKGRTWIENHSDRVTLVKVTIPSEPSDDGPYVKALVFNQDRSLYGFAPIKKALLKAMADRTRGYFYVEVKGKVLRFCGRAADQDW